MTGTRASRAAAMRRIIGAPASEKSTYQSTPASPVLSMNASLDLPPCPAAKKARTFSGSEEKTGLNAAAGCPASPVGFSHPAASNDSKAARHGNREGNRVGKKDGRGLFIPA